MKQALRKDVTREIRHTLSRFIGILVIVALGVSFFTGLGATGVDMKLTGDEYFDAQGLMDIRVICTYGLTDDDIQAIRGVQNVSAVYPSYNIDAMVTHNGVSYIAKAHSLESVNRPSLISGRFPEKPGEALVEQDFLGLKPGDIFKLVSGKDTDIRVNLRTDTFRIVGVALSPYYISRERGSSSIGDGSVDYFIYIDPDNFLETIYSEAFVQLNGIKDLLCFEDSYQDIVDKAVDDLEDLADIRAAARYREMTDSAYNSLALARTRLEAQEAQARQELDAGRRVIDETQSELDGADYDMPRRQTIIIESLRELDARESQVQSGLREINTAELNLDERELELIQGERGVTEQRGELDSQSSLLAVRSQRIALLDMADPENQRLKAELDAAGAGIAAGYEALSASMAEIEAGKKAISETREGLLNTERSLKNSLLTISESREILRAAQNELFSGALDISGGRRQLDISQAELAQSRLNITKELDIAWDDINNAQQNLDDLDMPEWYVLDRNSNPGYASFSQDTDKVTAIGRVFPLVFFLVAALVSLTTMTRLVEERRTEIGVLKSLGYDNRAIISKYVFYATAPTIVGGLAGGYGGMKLFPAVIIQAYGMLYTLPRTLTPISAEYWLVGVGIALFCTVTAAVSSCMKELGEMPAGLMRPKAPKAVKKILLERISVFWKRLTFTQKVTLRNIFRYKKRFYMTIAGIAGCTALLLTAFGLMDSVAAIMGLQYKDIALYDMSISFMDNAKQRDVTRVSDILQSSSNIQGFIKLREKAMDALNPALNLSSRQFFLIVPEDMDNLNRFIVFRDRTTKQPVSAPDSGVLITEKLSTLLNLEIGDQILLKDGDKSSATVAVSGITENYFFHYIYMTSETYERLYGEPPDYNAVYALLDDNDASLLANEVLDERAVNSLTFTQNSIDSFNDTIKSLNFVVFILVLSAGALAFVVLMNLSSINISERMRELATIEVLGFYDNEVSSYVFRESAVLTVLGALVGLGLGIGLHLYVLLSAETDIMMFGRDIMPMSHMYSLALTLFFSVFANVFSSRRLKRIQMVEALKSVE
ncbi:MAG: ABC transporter permease [Clostridiales bacterium]|nr:ABC transporter permease [Clostridiales bacterium]